MTPIGQLPKGNFNSGQDVKFCSFIKKRLMSNKGGTAANTRKGNVELAVIKDFADEIDANALESLTLGLVDRHRESRLDWELVPRKREAEDFASVDGDSQDADFAAIVSSFSDDFPSDGIIL
uniref:Uncharacterized protein n=1 Tax=Acrobeloides nanus TaxID=290746 RepID=A0A914DBB6_9BILA